MPKGTANPQPLRCLVRSSDGWWVQLSRNGIEHRHLFKFGAIRSEPEALALAQARRDQLMQEHPEVPGWRTIERAICNGKPGGIVYVAGPGKQSSYWCAETPMADGTLMRETFSIARFSRTAKQLAIAERERQLNLMVAGFAVKAELDAASNRLGNGQKDAAMYGIVRYKTYWLVKLERSRQRFGKTFSFAQLGGVQDALAQAQAWRDDVVRRHPPVMRQQRANKLRSNNKTGIAGVTCVLGPDGRPRNWSAHTYIGPGQLLQKTFSVYRHGEDAQTLAIAERQKQLEQMEGRARLHPVEEQVRSSSARKTPRRSAASKAPSSARDRSRAEPPRTAPTPRSTNAQAAPKHESHESGLIRKPDAMYGINEYATKWIVNLKRGGENIAKAFAFSTHGGREAALAQAQAWRDEQIHRHPQQERREHAQRIKRNNTSGIPGVRCQCWPDGRPMRWTVHTQIAKGVILTKTFGVKTHGYEQAKQMAIAARERHLEQMNGRYSRHPADDVDPDAPAPVAQIHHQPRATKTGIVGVELTYSKKGRPQSWVAKTLRSGLRQVKSFAIATYGHDKAKVLAVAERERQLRRVKKHGSGPKK